MQVINLLSDATKVTPRWRIQNLAEGIELDNNVRKFGRWPMRREPVRAEAPRDMLGYDAIERAVRALRTGLVDKAARYSLHARRRVAHMRVAGAGCTDAQIREVARMNAETGRIVRRNASR